MGKIIDPMVFLSLTLKSAFVLSALVFTEPTPNWVLTKYNNLKLYVLWVNLKKRVHLPSLDL